MKTLRFYFFLCLFLSLIAGCVPEEKSDTVQSYGSLNVVPDNKGPVLVCDFQTFTAESDSGKDLMWFLDGHLVGKGSEFKYTADVNEKRTRQKKIHFLSVKEASLFYRNAKFWVIIDEQDCYSSQPGSETVPSPEPVQENCTTNNACEAGILTPIGSGYAELEKAKSVSILSFSDESFNISLVSGEKGVIPPTQEGYATALIDVDGVLFSKFGDLTLLGTDSQTKILDGGEHLIVLIIDNAPAISDIVGRSDIGENDLIAYTKVVVDNDTTFSIDYMELEWTSFYDLVDRTKKNGDALNTTKAVAAPAVPIGYDPFSGSCFIGSARSNPW